MDCKAAAELAPAPLGAAPMESDPVDESVITAATYGSAAASSSWLNAGEELTWKYCNTAADAKANKHTRCLCGASNCTRAL